MINVFKTLSSYKVNTSSKIRAMDDLRSLDFDGDAYRKMVFELTGRDVEFGDEVALHVAQYVVSDVLDGGLVDLETSIERATKLVDSSPWINVETSTYSNYKPKSTVDCLGAPKKKKGAKKEQAIKFWNENQGKFNSRKEWIENLMSAVGLSKGGASTYYHNLKTGQYK